MTERRRRRRLAAGTCRPQGARQRGAEGSGGRRVSRRRRRAAAIPYPTGQRRASAPLPGLRPGPYRPAGPDAPRFARGSRARRVESRRSPPAAARSAAPGYFCSVRPYQAKLSLLRASPRAEAAIGHHGSGRPRWGGEPGPEGTRRWAAAPSSAEGTRDPATPGRQGRRHPAAAPRSPCAGPWAQDSRGRAPPCGLWSRPQRRARRGGRSGGGPSEGRRGTGRRSGAGGRGGRADRRALPEAPRFLPRERALRSRPAPAAAPAPAPPCPAGLGWARAPRRLLPRSPGSPAGRLRALRHGVVPALSVEGARVYPWCPYRLLPLPSVPRAMWSGAVRCPRGAAPLLPRLQSAPRSAGHTARYGRCAKRYPVLDGRIPSAYRPVFQENLRNSEAVIKR